MKINKQSSIYFVSFFTCVIFGFILFLYLINNLLADKINTAKNKQITQILTKNMPCADYKYSKTNNTNFYYCTGKNIIALNSISDFAYADKIQYLVFLNIDNENIEYIEIINHKETPGLGDKLMNKQWLATIYKKSKQLLSLKQDGGAIDSFTAASLTPKTLLKSLNKDIDFIINNKQNLKTKIRM